MRPDDLVLSPRYGPAPTARDRARDFLLTFLGDGHWHNSVAVIQAAELQGIGDKPLRNAREALPVEIERRGRGVEHASWWRLADSGPRVIGEGGSREGTSPDGGAKTGSEGVLDGAGTEPALTGAPPRDEVTSAGTGDDAFDALVAKMGEAGLAPKESPLLDAALVCVETLAVGNDCSVFIERPLIEGGAS
jgi:hypothetical protein